MIRTAKINAIIVITEKTERIIALIAIRINQQNNMKL
jgi:hypothetical protein